MKFKILAMTKRDSDIRKQNIKTKLIAVLEKVIDTLPKPYQQTHDIFDSLKSFEKLIGGEDFQQIIQNIIAQKEKEDIEASKRYYTEEGHKLHSLGKYKDAIECYDKVLNIKPDDSAMLYYKGLAFYNLSEYDEALRFFNQSFEINPKDNDAAKYKELVIDKIKKQSATTWNEKGEELNKQRKYEEALQWFERSLDASGFLYKYRFVII